MWPRTPEEHARGRNTGFVCFMNREDAQEAMDAFQERDPLRTGRRMWLRWGKNVKKIVRRGTGGIEPIAPIRKKTLGSSGKTTAEANAKGDKSDGNTTLNDSATIKNASDDKKTVEYDESKHAATAIKVIPPTDEKRLKFITTVASFVAKDGSILEKKLVERELNNPLFSFLHPNSSNINEQIYYRWRVFAFTQGDGFDSWRVDPFIMIEPNGRFWIPPQLDKEKALREKMEKELKEDRIRIKQERRRKNAASGKNKDYLRTGRQSDHSNQTSADDGITRLHAEDLAYWNHMIDKKLCMSRDAICELMAFCFDKSAAAQHISQLLKGILMDNRKGVSVETKISRLYLMSDILFNSQQPGVKNAFRYRDAIEEMAVEVFKCLGTHGNGNAGRMTMNKLRNTVQSVLAAWAKWSVYNVTFLNQLEACFEGKPIENEDANDKVKEDSSVSDASKVEDTDPNAVKEDISDKADDDGIVTQEHKPTSIWVEKTENCSTNDENDDDIDGEDLNEDDLGNGLVEIDDDLDGESLHDSDFENE